MATTATTKTETKSTYDIYQDFKKENKNFDTHIVCNNLAATVVNGKETLKWSQTYMDVATAKAQITKSLDIIHDWLIPKNCAANNKYNDINLENLIPKYLFNLKLCSPQDFEQKYKNIHAFVNAMVDQLPSRTTHTGSKASTPLNNTDKKYAIEIFKQVYTNAVNLGVVGSTCVVLEIFRELNPKFNFTKIDFTKTDAIKWSHPMITKEQAIAGLKEGILRIETNLLPSKLEAKRVIAIEMIKANINSSLDIVDNYSPETFKSKFSKLFENNKASWAMDEVYNNALEMRSRILMHYMNANDLNESHYAATPWGQKGLTTESNLSSIASFESLFGKDVYEEVPHDQSVFSPAAYLFELKKYIDMYVFQDQRHLKINNRRSDILKIPLDREHIETVVPKLQIVNNLLESKLGDNVYENLAQALSPSSVPFLLPFHEANTYLQSLDLDLAQVNKSFSSDEQFTELVSDPSLNNFFSSPSLAAAFDVRSTNLSLDDLETKFKIDFNHVNELLRADLSDNEIQNGLAETLFVNIDDAKNPIGIAEDKSGKQTLSNLNAARLTKLIKLVKLHKLFSLSITDLQYFCLAIVKIENTKGTDKNFFNLVRKYLNKVNQILLEAPDLTMVDLIALLGVLKNQGEENPETILLTAFSDVLGSKLDLDSSDLTAGGIFLKLVAELKIDSKELTYVLKNIAKQLNSEDANFSSTELSLDENTLGVVYRVASLMRNFDLSFLDLEMILAINANDKFFLPFNLNKTSSFVLDSTLEILNTKNWLEANSKLSYEANYFLSGELGTHFGDVSSSHTETLSSYISQEVSKVEKSDDADKYSEAVNSSLASLIVKLYKVEDTYEGTVASWAPYLFNGLSLEEIAAKDKAEQLKYFNALNRFKSLIQGFKIPVNSLQKLLTKPSIYDFDVGNITLKLNYERMQEVALIKDLSDKLSDSNGLLLDFAEDFNAKALAELTTREESEIEALINLWNLKTNNSEKAFTYSYSVVNKINQCFDLSDKSGLSISSLVNIQQQYLKADFAAWQSIANELKATLIKSSAELYKSASEALLELKRDVLVDLYLWSLRADKTLSYIKDTKALSEYLLLDVDVSSKVETSFVKEATLALQLYVHRCEMNLESGASLSEIFKDTWAWMQRYSVWEANRLVFLYPENYIEPELRKDKTPLFDKFSNLLNRGNITEEHIDSAYNKYLDAFLDIANLKIVNLWVQDSIEDSSKKLILIGRTTDSDGYKYYYRISSFKHNDKLDALVPDDWSYWQEIETKIPTKWITPINAFGRLYLFWVELRDYDGDDDKLKNTSLATIKCCFYNYRAKWSQPQTVKERISIKAQAKTAQERDDQKFHELTVSNSSHQIKLNYSFMKSSLTNLMIDPHMQVTETPAKQGFKADLLINKVNNKTGFLDGTGCFNNTGLAVTNTNKSLFTIAGWYYLEYNKDGTQICNFTDEIAVKSQFFSQKTSGMGVQLYSKSKKLHLNDLKKTDYDTGIELKAKTWYFIGVQIQASYVKDLNELTGMTYKIPKLLVIEGQYTNKVLGGTIKRNEPRKFVVKPGADLAKKILEMQVKLMRLPGGFAAKNEIELKMARKVTAMQNSKGSVKDLMFFNSLMNLDDLIELSNISRAVQPQVHVAASNSFELDFVPNSDEQMILVQNENDAYLAVNNTQQTQQYFYRLSSSVATTFNNIYSSNVDGISALLSSDTQLTKESSFAELKPDEKFIAKAYWPEDQYIDLNGADGIYYWELFFYVPLLLAKSFANNYEHEKAKKWFEYVFNPANSSNASAGNIDANDKFWKFIGMQSSHNTTLRYEHFSNANFETLSELEDGKLQPKWDTHLAAITKYHNDPFDPHAIARLRPIAYQKWVFRAYVDNLINWGDDLYRENTRETLQEAFMFYQVASNLLGEKPISVGEAKQSSVKNLLQLTRLSAGLNSFLLGLENSLSFTGALNSSPVTTPHNDIVNAYFKVPENISFIKIWDTVAERLYNLRYQLTIDGEPNNLPLFQPPADPMKMIAAANSGSMNFASAAGALTKLPPYRFSKVFSLANQFASVLYRFEIKLSGAIAQKAGHTLQELRASHMANIQKMMLDNRVNMVKIAQSRLDTMKLSLERTKYKKDYYETMLNYGIGKKSKDLRRYSAALGLKDVSLVFTQLAANFMEASAVCSFMKMVGAPLSGLIVGMACGGANLSGVPEGAAHAATQQAFAFQTEAAVFERMAAQLERAQSYFFMKKESEEQIKILNKRIKAAELSVQNAKNQLQIQKEQIKFYNKMDEYYKERFLNEELYTWMVQEMTTIYKQGYNMAYDIAMQAQAAYQYEILDESANFITNSWDDSRKGFLAAEAIQNDLMRMEKAYYEKNVRDFEIVKEVSLAETDAVALMQLMETGKCDFSLRESLFNADYPGHYQRRIKSVSISILSSLKPTRINATLTQVSNKILTEPNADLVSYVDTGKNAKGKDSLPEDTLAKLKLNFSNNQKIATSKASSDPGLFTLSFDYDMRYLPFEGTGAVSDWHLEIAHTENKALLTSMEKALGASYIIIKLEPQDLVDFLKNMQAKPDLKGAFHNEVVTKINKYMTVESLAEFISLITAEAELTEWFNNIGKTTLDKILAVLEKYEQKDAASALSNYLTTNAKDIPADLVESNLATEQVLSLEDVVIKVSYAAKTGSEAFKEEVRGIYK